jgi:hypothetical protein
MDIRKDVALTLTVIRAPRGFLTHISASSRSPISGTASGKCSSIHLTNSAGRVIRAKSAVGANKVHVNDLSY